MGTGSGGGVASASFSAIGSLTGSGGGGGTSATGGGGGAALGGGGFGASTLASTGGSMDGFFAGAVSRFLAFASPLRWRVSRSIAEIIDTSTGTISGVFNSGAD